MNRTYFLILFMVVGLKTKKMSGKGGKDEESKYLLMKIKDENESNNALSSVSNFGARSEKSGFCMAQVRTKCGSRCEEGLGGLGKGICSWTHLGRGFEKMEKCSVGTQGQGTYCTCGDCYRRICMNTSYCKRKRGRCLRKSPGKDWTRIGFCGTFDGGCSCFVQKDTKCREIRKCLTLGGKCQKQKPGRDWISANVLYGDGSFPIKDPWCHGNFSTTGCQCWLPPCTTGPRCPRDWSVCTRGHHPNHIHYRGPCGSTPRCSCIQKYF